MTTETQTQTEEHMTRMLIWSGVALVALIALAYIFLQ
jgi:hypothetical protein